jgi:hypothetical protein
VELTATDRAKAKGREGGREEEEIKGRDDGDADDEIDAMSERCGG